MKKKQCVALISSRITIDSMVILDSSMTKGVLLNGVLLNYGSYKNFLDSRVFSWIVGFLDSRVHRNRSANCFIGGKTGISSLCTDYSYYTSSYRRGEAFPSEGTRWGAEHSCTRGLQRFFNILENILFPFEFQNGIVVGVISL